MSIHTDRKLPAVKTIGFLLNPVAGLGGRVGLKGSDGAEIQRRALELGAQPQSHLRAEMALTPLIPLADRFTLLCAPGPMGEDAAKRAGLSVQVVGTLPPGPTGPEDTRRLAAQLTAAGAELLLFAGGDGTARDVLDAVGDTIPVIGIPAGVKIHSAVYAVNPLGAGRAAADFLEASRLTLHEAEVMDIDEDAFRENLVSTRLYGYMKTPAREHMQNAKAGGYSEAQSLHGIAGEIIQTMDPEVLYLIGPGTTTRSILDALELPSTLLGVDVLKGRRLLARDADEATLLSLLETHPKAQIIVTVIGGQGHIFGRGNHQFSPRVLRRVGRENIRLAATKKKLVDLLPSPLLVDTGDEALDRELCGYWRVLTGYQESTVARVSC